MTKPNFKKFIGNVQTSVAKHSPEILTGLGIAGMLTTTVLAVRATPKALRLIEQEKSIQAYQTGEDIPQTIKLKAKDVIRVTWKCYIPSAITAATSVACLIGASSVHTKRNAVLATAYKLSESALVEYKEKVVETIGEKKERTIREEIKKDHLKKNPASKNEIIITEKGNTLCYDHYSRRYFRSDIDKIKRAVNEINKQLLHESYVSLNDFYSEINLPTTDYGEKLGWNSDGGLIDVHYSSLLGEDGTPCLAIDFNTAPKYDFDKFF